jgi:streptomycin 6-kinase
VTELAKRVGERLSALHLGESVGELVPLPGGHSGLTYAVDVGPARYVVKASVASERPVGRNDMLRQARVLRALQGTDVPVPGLATLDESAPGWFAMEYVPGDAVEPVLDEHELPGELLRARMLDLAAVLARLHRLDATALADVPLDTAAELERWSRTMHAVPEDLRVGGAELMERLGADVPAAMAPCLVHGDFRLGNALCQGPQVRAVIDWEIWSLGDPRADLAWFLLFTDHRRFPQLGSPVPGLPTERELLDVYLGGATVPLDLDWFRALSRAKMAAIMGHNLGRHRSGRRHDPDQERLPPTIAAMIRAGHHILDQGAGH